MKFYKFTYLLVIVTFFISTCLFAQQKRKIDVKYAGDLEINEEKYPGAKILTRDDSQQIHIIHDGIDMWCDQAIHYENENFVEAYGNVIVKQGDSINMNSNYVEYSGITKLAYASGDVVLTDPTSTIKTDTLYMDRVKQQAYYRSGGTVVKDSSGTITSQIGRYYMSNKKYQFVQNVKLVNPEYVIDSDQLDYYSETGRAYLFGPTTITGETSTIYCERGFYDTKNDTGYFLKKSRIDYDDRVIEGDSLYFDRNRKFASATNNIKITDTINKAIIKGHYAEVFREKDSVFITKRALAISVQENDSIYIHSDTLMVTGKPENRITRAYYNAKIYKSDISGKADSIHVNHKTGLTKLINLGRFSSNDNFAKKRTPVLWNIGNQMTGDTIHLISNPETKKLDSLKVFDNAFIISNDTIGDGYHQMSGKQLFGFFKDNKLSTIDIIKNAESIYYMRNDKNELVGTDKSKSGIIKIWITDNAIDEVRKIKDVDGNVFPEGDFPEKESLLRGFVWRDDERPKSVDDLFKDDPPLELPIIKGLEDYVPQDEFFDEALMKRVEASDKNRNNKKEESKASRKIPKTGNKPSKKITKQQ
ncbi:OstA-like protein [Pontimicrobium sp. SW4]|uniref:OstA-like protein n=1 Tax=Pontimicrobium sp. SW4 TaxID=3153519 RepID=A0AAU7BPV1_9FLAO